MEFIDERTIKSDKELNSLDELVLKFLRIIEKYASYVIISGYVSILLGRSRATEDVDLFISEISFEDFEKFYNEIKGNGFWCLNAEDAKEVYSYLSENLAIRFAENGITIPNFEVKIARKPTAIKAIIEPLTVKTLEGDIKISPLEQQIAYKLYFLKSDKDIEDARHLEKVFKDKINHALIERYKALFENELPKT